MKKLLFLIVSLLAINYSYAQVTTDPITGDVGISNSSPQSKLDVSGLIHVAYPGIISYPTTQGVFIGWNKSGGGGEANFVNNIGGGVTGGFTFDNTTGGTSFTRLMTLSNNGNVGIGTVLPDAKLGVESALSGNFKGLALDNRNTGNGTGTSLYMGFQADSNDPYGIRLLESGTPTATRTGTFAIQRHGAAPGDTDWLNSLFIDYTGYVGIGTTRPDQALTVSGTVHATEILVDQNVQQPDYVFDKDYDLATLKDVKTYIDQNHDLPEIPSAAQVAKDGINLGEMNAKLLKKIEELTIYLIEEHTKNQNQQQQIDNLKAQLEEVLNTLAKK